MTENKIFDMIERSREGRGEPSLEETVRVGVVFSHGRNRLTGHIVALEKPVFWDEGQTQEHIFLVIDPNDSGNGPWAGKTYEPGQEVHGQFGYDGDVEQFHGKLFRGKLEVLWVDLPRITTPCAKSFYLHINEEGEFTEAQRQLLIRACFPPEGQPRFSAGASVTALIPIEEAEASLGKKIYRAR